ncbi:MAG: DUF465 domain-containing protein [Deltaproteobacteria bacterium]|nr:DUF465 domain-containing protein [Deltaproteobacteria bacterium]
MERGEDAIARVLAEESEAFRAELEAHRRYEEILAQLVLRPRLSADEEIEKRKIQKLKLAGKDRMARMILAYRRQHPELTRGGDRAEEGRS